MYRVDLLTVVPLEIVVNRIFISRTSHFACESGELIHHPEMINWLINYPYSEFCFVARALTQLKHLWPLNYYVFVLLYQYQVLGMLMWQWVIGVDSPCEWEPALGIILGVSRLPKILRIYNVATYVRSYLWVFDLCTLDTPMLNTSTKSYLDQIYRTHCTFEFCQILTFCVCAGAGLICGLTYMGNHTLNAHE